MTEPKQPGIIYVPARDPDDVWCDCLFAIGVTLIKPIASWTLRFGDFAQEVELLRLDAGYRATCKGAGATHFRAEAAVAAVLALGPLGADALTAKSSEWLDVHGCIPTDLQWTPACEPGAYMLKIIRGDVR